MDISGNRFRDSRGPLVGAVVGEIVVFTTTHPKYLTCKENSLETTNGRALARDPTYECKISSQTGAVVGSSHRLYEPATRGVLQIRPVIRMQMCRSNASMRMSHLSRRAGSADMDLNKLMEWHGYQRKRRVLVAKVAQQQSEFVRGS